jgi:hypothetical protein
MLVEAEELLAGDDMLLAYGEALADRAGDQRPVSRARRPTLSVCTTLACAPQHSLPAWC